MSTGKAANTPSQHSMGDEILLVNVDARLIMQVVVNLVDNAIKYTPWARSFRFRLTGKTIRS